MRKYLLKIGKLSIKQPQIYYKNTFITLSTRIFQLANNFTSYIILSVTPLETISKFTSEK